MDASLEQIMIDQVTEAQSRHPSLELIRDSSGHLRVRGCVGFSIEYDSSVIEDRYNVEILIPDDYPASPPFVFEPEGKIPKDFEHFMAAGNLCLGAPVEVRRRFAQHKNLLRFIEGQVIPYLFAYSYKREHGGLPFGDLHHGVLGLLQYYGEFFGTAPVETLKLLKCLADDVAAPVMACPCGAESKLRDCHGPRLGDLRPHQPPTRFEAELMEMIGILRRAGIAFPESKVIPKRMQKQQNRRWRRKMRRRR